MAVEIIEVRSRATPGGHEVRIMRERGRLAYRAHPVDTGKGEQFDPECRAIDAVATELRSGAGDRRRRQAVRTRRAADRFGLAVGLLAATCLASARAEPIGEVDTVFKLIGPDHKIVVDAYDDPKVAGVTCYVSRAKTGGLKGAVGLAEDTSDASIACRQVGPIAFSKPLPKQEEIFNERLSVLFKRLRVVRMVDVKRNALIYLTYSDRVIEGSPKNSITAVPIDRGTTIPVR